MKGNEFKGKDLLKLSTEQMQIKVRGNDIAMIFQDPLSSLNPVHTVGAKLQNLLLLHQKVSKKEAYEKAIEMLKLIGIPSPEKRVKEYPHQLSGGMQTTSHDCNGIIMPSKAINCR